MFQDKMWERKDPGSFLCKLNSLVLEIFLVNVSQNALKVFWQGSLSAHTFSISSLLSGTTVLLGQFFPIDEVSIFIFVLIQRPFLHKLSFFCSVFLIKRSILRYYLTSALSFLWKISSWCSPFLHNSNCCWLFFIIPSNTFPRNIH